MLRSRCATSAAVIISAAGIAASQVSTASAVGFGSSNPGPSQPSAATADLGISFADLDVDQKSGVITTGVYVTNLWGPAVARNVRLQISNGQAKSVDAVGINSGFQIDVKTRGTTTICAVVTSTTPDNNPVNNQSCKTIISFPPSL